MAGNMSNYWNPHRRRLVIGIRRAVLRVGDRAKVVAQMDEIDLSEVMCTDFTELFHANSDRKAVLMPIIGHASRLARGWAVGETGSTTVALRGWRRTTQTLCSLEFAYSATMA